MKTKMLFCLLLTLLMSYANATKVSPVRFDMSITRGSSKEFTLNLIGSKGSHNQDLVIYPSDLFMSRTGALSFDIIAGSKNSCVKWIKMERSKLSLLEDQTKEVKFKISIPSNATPGEYYAVIMVEPEKFTDVKDNKNPVMLQMKTRVAIVIVLDVPGRTYEKKGEVIEAKIVETDSLVKITSAFKNTGDIHLDVLAEAIIRSADGKTNYGKFNLKALSSSKDEAFVFPDAIRDFEGVLDRQLPTGDYLVDVSFNYGYDFKKARKTQKFSIKRKISLDESKTEFLVVEPAKIEIQIPAGATRTQIVKITNTDYRPLTVAVESNDWIKINPKTFNLKQGEVKNIQAIISVSEYKESKKEANIVLKTDRGKSTKLSIVISKPESLALKEEVIKNIKEKLPAVKDSIKVEEKPKAVEEKKIEQPKAIAKDSVKEKVINPEEKLIEDVKQIPELPKDNQKIFILLGMVVFCLLFLISVILIRKAHNRKSNK